MFLSKNQSDKRARDYVLALGNWCLTKNGSQPSYMALFPLQNFHISIHTSTSSDTHPNVTQEFSKHIEILTANMFPAQLKSQSTGRIVGAHRGRHRAVNFTATGHAVGFRSPRKIGIAENQEKITRSQKTTYRAAACDGQRRGTPNKSRRSRAPTEPTPRSHPRGKKIRRFPIDH